MLNNHTNTDCRTGYKNILILDYDLIEPNHKTMSQTFIGCFIKTGQDKQLELIPKSHILFYKVFHKLLSTPKHSIFSDPLFLKMWYWKSPQQKPCTKGGGGWYCEDLN